MPSLNKTKRRINSINSTKKITKAMELVSTVKLRRYKNVMLNNDQYTDGIISLVQFLFSSINEKEDYESINKYLNANEEGQDLYIVISSNLGLCAGFNNDILRYATKNIDKENSIVLPIGLKGHDFLEKEGYKIDDSYVSINEKIEFEPVTRLANYVHNKFINKEVKSVKLIYTKYVNSIRFTPQIMDIFPLCMDKKSDGLAYPPIFDPDIKTLIKQFIPLYVNCVLYQRLVEAQVSEQASRRMAMENANDNADELINQLTLEYNKARQAQITQEINEVIAGQAN